MTSNVFDQTVDNDPKNTNDQQPGLFDQMVGDGKKFQDANALAKAKQDSDQFINHLQGELAELREELNKTDNAEKNLDTLRQEISALKERLEQKSSEPSQNTTGALTAEEIKEVVKSTITEKERNNTRDKNISDANSLVEQHYGSLDKAREAVATRAQELGMTVKDLEDVASKSPSAFAKMVVDTPTGDSTSAPIKGDINTNTQNFGQNKGPEFGTKAYWSAMRKEKGRKWYFLPETQNAVMKSKLDGLYDKE